MRIFNHKPSQNIPASWIVPSDDADLDLDSPTTYDSPWEC